jgi:hypothetical protein
MAVSCSESIECLPGISSRYFLCPLVNVPVVPVATDITLHVLHLLDSYATIFILLLLLLLFVVGAWPLFQFLDPIRSR